MVVALKIAYAMHELPMQETNTLTHLSGLASLLVHEGCIDIPTIKNAIHHAKQHDLALVTYLIRNELVSSQTILACCVKHFNLPIFDLRDYDLTLLNHPFLTTDMMYRYHLIPFKQHLHFLEIGVSDPTNQSAFSVISFHIGLPIRLILVAENLLDELVNTHCRPNILHSQLQTTLSKLVNNVEEIATHNIALDQEDEPVTQFVDRLILEAVEKKISDIHIEPHAKYCRIRFRRDGLLYEAASLPIHLARRVITRLKIMASLNIAERRLPQDGQITRQDELKTDIRLNTCPTLFGEKIVLRLLQINTVCKDMHSLGLTPVQKKIFLEKLIQPQGLILIAGPTGSGKTMSLYAALDYLNKIEKNIVTVEDPVEIACPGINQININPRIGLDFVTILRALLRQDPDIIMIGEIRDRETALIATQAAQTGHLVLSTVHANKALEAILRLQSMGVSVDHLISSLSLIIAQRLIRRLCKYCKLAEMEKDEHINQPSHPLLGCERCHQGYEGRIGIFECIPITHTISEYLLSKKSIFAIETLLRNEGNMLLWEAGLEKIQQGVTNYAELLRVIGK